MQITEPDERVLQLVEELAAGPLPSWDPPPALLLLNKVRWLRLLCRKAEFSLWSFHEGASEHQQNRCVLLESSRTLDHEALIRRFQSIRRA